MKLDFKTLIFSVAFCLGAGVLGSVFTTSGINTWYVTLNKPAFNPPNWIFAPVWTTLYILMGISFYLVLKSKSKDKTLSVKLFLAQLFLNVLWSFVFFGLHSPMFGFATIFILWISIISTIVHFDRISKPAAYLLLPYLGWVTFASFLNLSIVLLNL